MNVIGRRGVKRIVRRFVEDELLDGQRPNGDPLGEGMLEIGVVMASLYFIARKKLFPVISLIFGVLGIVVAISGGLL